MKIRLCLFAGLSAVVAHAIETTQVADNQQSAISKPVPLFNGKDLKGWQADVPSADKNPNQPASFIVREGMLVSLGEPKGHLITEQSYGNYRLAVEYRFPKGGGNCGVLVHVSKLRVRGNLFPKSLEVQMMHQDAGDFWCIEEDIRVPDMEKRRPRAEGQKWGVSGTDARRILNLTDGSEKPLGEWNRMEIACQGREVRVWVNGTLVNHGFDCTADQGRIALQAEGTEVEFRKIELTQLADPAEGLKPVLKQGRVPAKPRLVGRFSSPAEVEFVGNAAIPTERLCRALMQSSMFILASHPGAEFQPYLQTLQRSLELGYLAHGFPESSVKVDWDEKRGTVVAVIKEGPRFKMGEIRVQGAKLVKVEAIKKMVILDEDAGHAEVSGENPIQNVMSMFGFGDTKAKELSDEQVKKNLVEAFPETFASDGNGLVLAPEAALVEEADESDSGVWEKGDWADFRREFLLSVKTRLATAYRSEGLFFPDFKLQLVPGDTPDVKDLAVEVLTEGPFQRLGKLVVAGNRNNTREGLMKYLAIEEGMELKGDFLNRTRQRLYESGRFLAWKVCARRHPGDAGKLDLFIQVSEMWEAPPLEQALTREQEVLLKFARWMNDRSTANEDLVLEFSGEGESGRFGLTIATNRDTVLTSFEALGHRISLYAEADQKSEVFIEGGATPLFKAGFPMDVLPFSANFQLWQAHHDDPFAPTGNVTAGMGFSSKRHALCRFAIDPAMAFDIASSERGLLVGFEGDELLIRGDGAVLRIDAASGRLISMKGEFNGVKLDGRVENGYVVRTGRRLQQSADGLSNWCEDKNHWSLLGLSLVFLGELAQDEALAKGRAVDGAVLDAAAARCKRWEPLVVLAGDVIGPMLELLDAADSEPGKDGGEDFDIPLDIEMLAEKLQSGSPVNLLLGLAYYEVIAQCIEPGTWLDLVMREVLFEFNGNTTYQEQTIGLLLEDSNIGPIGCVLCANLAQRVGNPAAAKFIAKARAGMNEEGFAKDWQLVFDNQRCGDGMSWKFIQALRKLDRDQIDGFVPENLPEIRKLMRDLVTQASSAKPETDSMVFRPVMDGLWEHAFEDLVEGMIVGMEQGQKKRVDPAVAAATVDGTPVLRAGMRLMEKVATSGGSLVQDFTLLNTLRRSMDPAAGAHFERDYCVAITLLARQAWSRNQAPNEEFVNRYAKSIMAGLGADGQKQLQEMGFDGKSFQWWVVVLLSAELECYTQLNDTTKQVPGLNEKARAYYESHKDRFSAVGGEQVNLYTIRLNVENDEQQQLKLMEEIRSQVAKQDTMDGKVKVFMEMAAQHSRESDTKGKGYRGWVQLDQEFNQAVAAEMAKVPAESLSEVIRVRIGDHLYFYLALIPEKKRAASQLPYERFASQATAMMLLEQCVEELRKRAEIVVLEDPSASGSAGGLMAGDGIVPMQQRLEQMMEGIAAAPKPDAVKRPQGEKPEWPKIDGPQQALSQAEKGRAFAVYKLGTYAERGISTEQNGVAPALVLYEKAAGQGNRHAMLRLAEIHRCGIGVAKDPAKSAEWRRKAFASKMED